MDEKYLREMDAMAAAAGLPREEVRMANLFPELFHCSGFAIYGDATAAAASITGAFSIISAAWAWSKTPW